MKHKPLIETNPYLRDPSMRDKLIEESVLSSCAVEGIKIDPAKFRETPRIEKYRSTLKPHL